LEALLKTDDLSIEMVPEIKEQIEKLQKPPGTKSKGHHANDDEMQDEEGEKASSEGNQTSVSSRLEQLERLVQEMNDRLKTIEARLPAQPKN
jgi:chromosome segregation ATPase